VYVCMYVYVCVCVCVCLFVCLFYCAHMCPVSVYIVLCVRVFLSSTFVIHL
jgi:hypothetical protein